MKALMIAVSALTVGLGVSQARAQTLSPADKTFATKAAEGGQAEVALGKVAMQNAGSPDVKAFGQRMVTDHTQANQALQELARRQNLTLPTKPASADMATEQRLQAMKGQAFDTAYMKDMVQDHQQDVADFQKEAQNGTDPELKAFAQKYLPVLQQHLQMAQQAAK